MFTPGWNSSTATLSRYDLKFSRIILTIFIFSPHSIPRCEMFDERGRNQSNGKRSAEEVSRPLSQEGRVADSFVLPKNPSSSLSLLDQPRVGTRRAIRSLFEAMTEVKK